MSPAIGAHIGGLRTLEDMRLRCFCDADTGCWHLRSAGGRPMQGDRNNKVWVYGLGVMRAPRAAWMFSTGKPIPPGLVVSRICKSYDCVRPQHLRCWTKAAEGRYMREHGRTGSHLRDLTNRANGAKRSRITPEMRQWLVESGQSAHAVAHALGVAVSHVAGLRVRAAKAAAGGRFAAAGAA